METTDFTTQDGRSSLQKLRRLLARAVSEARPVAIKRTWLTNTIGTASVDVTADTPWSRNTLDTDGTSNNPRPDLIAALTRAVSDSSTYGGDYKTQLLQDLVDADTILTA